MSRARYTPGGVIVITEEALEMFRVYCESVDWKEIPAHKLGPFFDEEDREIKENDKYFYEWLNQTELLAWSLLPRAYGARTGAITTRLIINMQSQIDRIPRQLIIEEKALRGYIDYYIEENRRAIESNSSFLDYEVERIKRENGLFMDFMLDDGRIMHDEELERRVGRENLKNFCTAHIIGTVDAYLLYETQIKLDMLEQQIRNN